MMKSIEVEIIREVIACDILSEAMFFVYHPDSEQAGGRSAV